MASWKRSEREFRSLSPGDRVVVPSMIACGFCSYCLAGYHAQCDNANPNGHQAGTAFFGGPEMSGPFNGLQAEYARIPWANTGLVKLAEEVSEDEAILISDIFPTGYFGAELAEIKPGDTVVEFGCGPVGQFAILSAKLMDAGRILAVDHIEGRLDMARNQEGEPINFDAEDPVEAIRELTGGIGKGFTHNIVRTKLYVLRGFACVSVAPSVEIAHVGLSNVKKQGGFGC